MVLVCCYSRHVKSFGRISYGGKEVDSTHYIDKELLLTYNCNIKNK